MKIIGLTGGIGSGKSTVSAYLENKGFTVLDADKIAREIVEPGSRVLAKLVDAFGEDILLPSGGLDRKKLGDIVFREKEKKEKLDGITHDEIRRIINQRIFMLRQDDTRQLVFIDAALLFEAGLESMTDRVWMVDTPDSTRIRRVMGRDGLSEEAVRARMKNQIPEAEKKNRAHAVLNNAGSNEELYLEIEGLLKEYV